MYTVVPPDGWKKKFGESTITTIESMIAHDRKVMVAQFKEKEKEKEKSAGIASGKIKEKKARPQA